jgi:hypothetical protein
MVFLGIQVLQGRPRMPSGCLQVLLLDSNQLAALPDSLGQLAKLERLSVAGNSLAALPATLGALRTLRQLDVSSNKLMALPEQLGACTALEELTAADNYLQVRACYVPKSHVHGSQASRDAQHWPAGGWIQCQAHKVPVVELRGQERKPLWCAADEANSCAGFYDDWNLHGGKELGLAAPKWTGTRATHPQRCLAYGECTQRAIGPW